MIMYSAADGSERRDVSAETMAKVVVSAEETADGGSAVKTGTAEDSVVVTETAGTTIPFPARTEDTAETRTARTEENGAAATKRQRTVNTPGTERREK